MNGERPPRIVGLGEALLRLSTVGHQRLEQSSQLDIHVAGAELNALVAAAVVGADALWVTRAADNPLGRRMAAHARAHGVTPMVDWDQNARSPLFFVEHGAVPRPSEVLYDRAHGAMASLTEESFDWPHVVDGARGALSSGITCALGEGAVRAVDALFRHARERGVTTAFDVNYRSMLWSWEQAAPVMRAVLAVTDVLAASRFDLVRLLGVDAAEPIELARAAIREFGVEIVLLRETEARPSGGIATSATAVTAVREYTSQAREAVVIDAFGAGDAAFGSFLVDVLSGHPLSDAVEHAAWACAIQHTIPGDAWLARASDRERIGWSPYRIVR